MTKKKIEICSECGREKEPEVKVPGYHWEIRDGYNWGHWVKNKRTVQNARIKKEEC